MSATVPAAAALVKLHSPLILGNQALFTIIAYFRSKHSVLARHSFMDGSFVGVTLDLRVEKEKKERVDVHFAFTCRKALSAPGCEHYHSLL